MIDRAPALAYYGILSLFPLLLVGFALLRLVAGADAPANVAAYASGEGASSAVADTLRSATATARSASAPAAGVAGAIGLLTLVYGASRAFTAAGRTLDVIARKPSTARSPVRRLQDMGWTLVVLVMALVLLVAVVLSGRALERLFGVFGADVQVGAWTVVRWPAAILVALLIVAVVRWAAPTGHRPPFRLVTPGGAVSVAVFVVTTVGYDLYVSSVASYNTTYGAFAGGVILLLWIWLASVAFLLGAELDAAIADARR